MPTMTAEAAAAKALAKSRLQRSRDGSGSDGSGSGAPPPAKLQKGDAAADDDIDVDDEPVAPATLEAMMAMMIASKEEQAQRDNRQLLRDQNMASTLAGFADKFTNISKHQDQVDVTLIAIQAQLNTQAAKLVAFEEEQSASPAVPASGASGSGGSARPPHFARVGGSVPPRRSDSGSRGPPDDSRTKVFFKNFPAEIPRRLLTAWFDRLYDLTDKEPGVERHIGSNSSFAVSFPSAGGAKNFMDQVRDDGLSLGYCHRGATTTIKMEPQYRTSVYGKALATVWKHFSDHCTAANTEESPITLLVDTDRGRFRADINDTIVLLAHVDKETLVFNAAGLDAIGFSDAYSAAVRRDFVA